jgi:hypothetical protein
MKNKNTAENCFTFFDQKLQLNYVHQLFLCLWIIFALLDQDTDPGIPLNPDPDPQHWSARVSTLNFNEVTAGVHNSNKFDIFIDIIKLF